MNKLSDEVLPEMDKWTSRVKLFYEEYGLPYSSSSALQIAAILYHDERREKWLASKRALKVTSVLVALLGVFAGTASAQSGPAWSYGFQVTPDFELNRQLHDFRWQVDPRNIQDGRPQLRVIPGTNVVPPKRER